MRYVSFVQRAVRRADAAVARAYLSLRTERPALIAFLFHSLFRDETEIARNDVDPLQRTTVAQFRQFVDYYRRHGYDFVTPRQVWSGLEPGGKYALITFDDGYYNNRLALPILDELAAPAVFFVSTENVRAGKCYWWDVLHRELIARGATANQLYREALALKGLPTERIEALLAERFGPACFTPRGDVDRPFTRDELVEFARHPRVVIGNHTANHAILTNYPPDDARRQVVRAQEWLASEIGRAPEAIAYPNGGHDDGVVRVCRDAGLKMGFTVRPEKTPLTVNPQSGQIMRLGRFTPHGEEPILTQCRTYRSDLLLYGIIRSGYLKARGRNVTQ